MYVQMLPLSLLLIAPVDIDSVSKNGWINSVSLGQPLAFFAIDPSYAFSPFQKFGEAKFVFTDRR